MDSSQLRWTHVRQHFDDTHLEDPYRSALLEIRRSGARFAKGERIAIAVGSRGIRNIDRIAKAAVDAVLECGATPFLIPAMGSHGGATPDGQRDVLAGYGITEQTMGAPVVSSLAVVELGPVAEQFDAYMSKDAFEADGVIAINRVKPHTDFHGPVESGVMKMLVIGLGKHRQALATHAHGVYGLRELIPQAAQRVLQTGKIRLGLGIVENAYDETLLVRGATADGIPQMDAELLGIARANMPSLPVEALDVLVLEQIGKDISGTCLDTNVIGRMRIRGEQEPASPDIAVIVALALTEGSHGNATGIGLCDIVTQALRDQIDFEATYENAATSTFLMRGMLPMTAKDEAQALRWALRAAGIRTPETVRAIRMRSTLHLSDIWVTPAVLKELQDGPLWARRRMEIAK